jgi:hypothetical protein
VHTRVDYLPGHTDTDTLAVIGVGFHLVDEADKDTAPLNVITDHLLDITHSRSF